MEAVVSVALGIALGLVVLGFAVGIGYFVVRVLGCLTSTRG